MRASDGNGGTIVYWSNKITTIRQSNIERGRLRQEYREVLSEYISKSKVIILLKSKLTSLR